MTKNQTKELCRDVFGQFSPFVVLREVRDNNIVIRREIFGPDISEYKKLLAEREVEERKPRGSDLFGLDPLNMMLRQFDRHISMPMRVWGSGKTWQEAYEDMMTRR